MTNNGDLRICCDVLEQPWGFLTDNKGRRYNAKQDDLEESRNSSVIRDLRASMLRGERHELCRQCWTREDVGLRSKRMFTLKSFPETTLKALRKTHTNGAIDAVDFPLKDVDVRIGNSCNLRCNTCGTTESSLWLNEEFAHLKSEETDQLKYYGKEFVVRRQKEKLVVDGNPFDWTENAQLFDDLMAQGANLRHLYFTGGEPLINTQHWRLLERLIEAGHSRKIQVRYNSNCTLLPQRALDIWRKFKSIHIGCSIDGIHEYANYIRPPSKWEVIERNLRELSLLPNLRMSLTPTISVLNIAHIPDMILRNLRTALPKMDPVVWSHLLFQPSHFSCQVLPLWAKHEIAARYEQLWEGCQQIQPSVANRIKASFEPVIQHMLADDKSHLLPQLHTEIQRQDRLNSRSLPHDLPALWRLLR